MIFLQRYLDLESLRHHNSFDYSIKVDETIDTDFETIPPMLIQPIVENAIKHGLVPRGSRGTLSIRFQMAEEDLICIVEDNGVGKNQATATKLSSHHSISTEVNEARLKLMSEQQKLKEKYRIDIEDKYDVNHVSSGTKVVIFFSTASVKTEFARHD